MKETYRLDEAAYLMVDLEPPPNTPLDGGKFSNYICEVLGLHCVGMPTLNPKMFEQVVWNHTLNGEKLGTAIRKAAIEYPSFHEHYLQRANSAQYVYPLNLTINDPLKFIKEIRAPEFKTIDLNNPFFFLPPPKEALLEKFQVMDELLFFRRLPMFVMMKRKELNFKSEGFLKEFLLWIRGCDPKHRIFKRLNWEGSGIMDELAQISIEKTSGFLSHSLGILAKIYWKIIELNEPILDANLFSPIVLDKDELCTIAKELSLKPLFLAGHTLNNSVRVPPRTQWKNITIKIIDDANIDEAESGIEVFVSDQNSTEDLAYRRTYAEIGLLKKPVLRGLLTRLARKELIGIENKANISNLRSVLRSLFNDTILEDPLPYHDNAYHPAFGLEIKE